MMLRALSYSECEVRLYCDRTTDKQEKGVNSRMKSSKFHLKHISQTEEQKNLTQIMNFIQPCSDESHHCINILYFLVVSVRNEKSKKLTKEEINGGKKEKMPTVIK